MEMHWRVCEDFAIFWKTTGSRSVNQQAGLWKPSDCCKTKLSVALHKAQSRCRILALGVTFSPIQTRVVVGGLPGVHVESPLSFGGQTPLAISRNSDYPTQPVWVGMYHNQGPKPKPRLNRRPAVLPCLCKVNRNSSVDNLCNVVDG